jgi:hypothetical protein
MAEVQSADFDVSHRIGTDLSPQSAGFHSQFNQVSDQLLVDVDEPDAERIEINL